LILSIYYRILKKNPLGREFSNPLGELSTTTLVSPFRSRNPIGNLSLEGETKVVVENSPRGLENSLPKGFFLKKR